jgi:hypothetical protein
METNNINLLQLFVMNGAQCYVKYKSKTWAIADRFATFTPKK